MNRQHVRRRNDDRVFRPRFVPRPTICKGYANHQKNIANRLAAIRYTSRTQDSRRAEPGKPANMTLADRRSERSSPKGDKVSAGLYRSRKVGQCPFGARLYRCGQVLHNESSLVSDHPQCPSRFHRQLSALPGSRRLSVAASDHRHGEHEGARNV